MKKIFTVLSIAMILLLSSCSILSALIPGAGISTGTVSTDTGYDLDNGKEYTDLGDSNVDLVLEPWWDSGSPAPALQLRTWGDSLTFIFDLGVISIDDAAKKSDDELVPDSLAWDDYVTEGHTYFVVIESGKQFYLYADKLDITEYDNYYDAELTFNYMEKK